MAVVAIEHPSLNVTARREGRTLEDVISGAWEDLIAHRTATCPICAAEMTPRYGSGPSAVGGRCNACAAELT